MEIYISKILFVFLLLFIGSTDVKAASNGDCLLDVFQSELKEKNSKDVHDYFLNKSEEDSNNAYQAWKVLYEADNSVDRLNTNNLTELVGYIKRSENELDAIIKKIKDAGGYVPFKSTSSWFVSFVDAPYKKALKADLEASKELVRSFNETTDLIKSWQLLYDLKVSDKFRQESINTYALHTHINKIHNLGEEFDFISLNNYVKHALNRDAHMESILFHDKLYGGIKISSELLSEIKPVSKKASTLKLTQYSGLKNVGSFEIRINGGKIERYLVDDAGVGSWKVLNATDEVSFVITNDGILRLGYGHYNISGEATKLISAGTLVIKDGKVTILKNTSGHYLPDADNLYGAERIFKELGVTSNDFKLDFHEGTIITERPVVNNTNAQIDELVTYTDEVYKAVLKEDLEASEELVKLFHKKPEVIASWQKLVDYPDLRKDIEVLKTYSNLKRIGNYSNTVKPVRISELTKMHPTPKLGKEAEFESLINSLKNEGFNLQEPIIAVQLPDGTKLVMDGNHRLDATIKHCGEKGVADVKVITQKQAIKKYGEASFFKRVRSGEISIQGNLSNEVLIKENADLIQQLGEENIVLSLKISKLSGFYKGYYKQPITRQGVTEEGLDAFSKSFMDQNFPGWESK